MALARAPRCLIANEGYEIGFTHHDGLFFNQPLPPITITGPGGQPITMAAPSPANQTDPSLDFSWGCFSYIIPIPPSTNGLLLQGDTYRNLFLIQNKSVGATATDVAPTLYFSLDGPVQADFSNAVALVPGEGLVLDTRVPNNAIYVGWGAGTGTFTQFGTCLYGRTTNAPPQKSYDWMRYDPRYYVTERAVE